jgi:hypothetical protein
MNQERGRLYSISFLLLDATKVERLSTKNYHVLPIWKLMVS